MSPISTSRARPIRIAICLVLLSSAGCLPVDNDCRAPEISTGAWPSAGGLSFNFRLPAKYKPVTRRGIDSETGGWAQGKRHVDYDYGAYSDPLADDPAALDRQVCRVRINGRWARLVVARDSSGNYLAAAHWPKLARTVVGETALTISTTSPDAAGRREHIASLWTVQIHP